jgi:hypothetical protein
MNLRTVLKSIILAGAALTPAAPAWAGPPFLTDDPIPAELGHWEIYAPVIEIEGKGADFEGALAAEFNYGAAPNLQLSVELPVAFAHDAVGRRSGVGDIELGAKYLFHHDDAMGLSISFYPSVTLPTAAHGLGERKANVLLPIWAQKDFGPWSVFGGGGYMIHPGAGNRDYWTGGIAVTRQIDDRLLLGAEAYRQQAAAVGERGSTSLGLGVIYELKAPLSLLLSGGPTFEDHAHTPGFHAYAALGLEF